MKLVKESLEIPNEEVWEAFNKAISYLRSEVYLNLNQDDLYELNQKLIKWLS